MTNISRELKALDESKIKEALRMGLLLIDAGSKFDENSFENSYESLSIPLRLDLQKRQDDFVNVKLSSMAL